MKKNIIKLVILLIPLFLFSGCSNKHMKEISYNEYKNLISNGETFALEIMRTGCSACESFDPILEDFLNEYNIDIKVINLSNLNEEDKNNIWSETSLGGTPTIIFYKNGKESSVSTRVVGSVPKNKLRDKFKDNGFLK